MTKVSLKFAALALASVLVVSTAQAGTTVVSANYTTSSAKATGRDAPKANGTSLSVVFATGTNGGGYAGGHYRASANGKSVGGPPRMGARSMGPQQNSGNSASVSGSSEAGACLGSGCNSMQ